MLQPELLAFVQLTRKGVTPADEGHLGVIVALLEVARPGEEATQKEKHAFSAFLNRSNSYGQTALMLACKNG